MAAHEIAMITMITMITMHILPRRLLTERGAHFFSRAETQLPNMAGVPGGMVATQRDRARLGLLGPEGATAATLTHDGGRSRRALSAISALLRSRALGACCCVPAILGRWCFVPRARAPSAAQECPPSYAQLAEILCNTASSHCR